MCSSDRLCGLGEQYILATGTRKYVEVAAGVSPHTIFSRTFQRLAVPRNKSEIDRKKAFGITYPVINVKGRKMIVIVVNCFMLSF